MDWTFLSEALASTVRIALIILPLLFLIDLLNHHYAKKIEQIIKRSTKLMPFLGAVFGLLPGCNVAVIVALFYTRGLASLGTLIAALIATSDEALYVFLPLGFNFLPLLATKFVLAVISGYLIDYFVSNGKIPQINKKAAKSVDFCCTEHPHDNKPIRMLVHALKHGLRIVLVVFVVLTFLNYAQDRFSPESLAASFNNLGLWQPILVSLVGLIPGCGTSVGIATLYVKGVITFGSAVAGLSTASGEAFIVMLGQGVKKQHIIKIAFILFIISASCGFFIQII
jgi:hypothetical protein